MEDYREIQLFKSGGEHKAAAKTVDRGIDVKNLSPFFVLEYFRIHLWFHFGLDYLHVSLEGNWRRIFEYVGLKQGNDFCKG